jgi:glutathione S-transferase
MDVPHGAVYGAAVEVAVNRLVGLSYSPWTWRAAAALRVAGVPFGFDEYLPTLGEPGLRWRLGRWSGRVSVPVLFPDDGPPVEDSLAIAVWASQRTAAPLVPRGRLDEVRRWADLGDEAAGCGRGLTTRRVLEDPAALADSLPDWVRALGPVGTAIGRDAAGRILRKYGADQASPHQQRERLIGLLDQLRKGLGGRRHLLGESSWADAAASIALAFVAPHAVAPLKPAARAAWTDAELAIRYEDLLAWRDAVVADAGGWDLR